VDRIVNVDAAGAKLAEQASIEILEARRAARNYLCPRPGISSDEPEITHQCEASPGSYLGTEPGDETIVQQGPRTQAYISSNFAGRFRRWTEVKARPAQRIREAVLAYEKDLDDLVRKAKHESRGQLIQELALESDRLISRVTEAIQVGSPASRQVAPTFGHQVKRIPATRVRAGKKRNGARNWITGSPPTGFIVLMALEHCVGSLSRI